MKLILKNDRDELVYQIRTFDELQMWCKHFSRKYNRRQFKFIIEGDIEKIDEPSFFMS